MSPVCPACGFDTDARPTRTWTIVLELVFPSLNQLKGNTKVGYAYRRWRREFEGALANHGLPTATCPRRVTVTRWYGKRKRAYDTANLSGGSKPLMDTLVNYGILYDDSPTWLEVHFHQRPSPDGVDRIELLIEEFQ